MRALLALVLLAGCVQAPPLTSADRAARHPDYKTCWLPADDDQCWCMDYRWPGG